MVKQTGGYKSIKGAGPGRPKGAKNKYSNFKDSLYEAFKKLGGTKFLVEWANENPTPFFMIMGKLLPKQIEADVNVRRSVEEVSNDELFREYFGRGLGVGSQDQDSGESRAN